MSVVAVWFLVAGLWALVAVKVIELAYNASRDGEYDAERKLHDADLEELEHQRQSVLERSVRAQEAIGVVVGAHIGPDLEVAEVVDIESPNPEES